MDVDVIVVPTARPATLLRHSLRLAQHLGCPVVALCSRRSDAKAACREASASKHLVAVDVDAGGGLPNLDFATSRVLADRRLSSRSDLSLKRNIGLAVATMVGAARVAFLDDDISVAEPDDMRRAAGLVPRYSMAALENVGFPDNSVVCHAIRRVSAVADVGVKQYSFVGSGAMVVATDRIASFFPNIYNEDWFFMLGDTCIRPVAVTGAATQAAYDPFADTRRARAQEFGDCLAEGIYAILDTGGHLQDADLAFWADFLADRARLIRRVIAAVERLNLPARDERRMTAALKAARRRGRRITPNLCVEYLRAWSLDSVRWRDYLERLPRVSTLEQALRHLGLVPRTVLPG